MQQLENELAQTQTNLETATHNLEEKEKALQNVSFFCKKVLKFLFETLHGVIGLDHVLQVNCS